MTPTVGDLSDARQPSRAASPPTSRVVHIVQLLAGANQPALTLAEIVRQTSLYLEAQMHPVATAAIVGGLGAAIGGAAWALNQRSRRDIGTRDAERRLKAARYAAG